MSTTLDVAAAASAVIWPIVVLVILLAYRKTVPALVGGLASRVTKLEFAGVALELAVAKPFVPDWVGSSGALDLRHKATSLQVTDSTLATFRSQLSEEGTGDYAEVNLGSGQEWLTSRLFIMAIVFARMKGIKCFVFVETSGSVRKRYVGWAEPSRIRWALAKRYPWFEQAYAEAYSTILSAQTPQPGFIVSNEGRLGFQFAQRDPGPSIFLLQEFLKRIQTPWPGPPDHSVLVDAPTNVYEHTRWINGEHLEEVLGSDCIRAAVCAAELQSKTPREQYQVLLAEPERFIAVMGEEQRFEYLVDRGVILDQVARELSLAAKERG